MRHTIGFFLNGTPIEIDFAKETNLYPQMPVLQYLRNHMRLTGTAQGCGTGDCGSCMVALAQRDKNKSTRLYAVNACLMLLGMMDGKHLITIEGIEQNGKKHPVQEVLTDSPSGIIMAAYAAYENGVPFTRDTLKTILSGNICPDGSYIKVQQALVAMEHRRNRLHKETFVVPEDNPFVFFCKSPVGDYIKPRTLEQLLMYRKTYPTYHTVCGASGFSVYQALEHPETKPVIDISDIPDLKRIVETEAFVTFGAGVTIEAFRETLVRHYPGAQEYLLSFASLPVRNRASLAGNLAGVSSVGDILPLLLALDAELELASLGKSRKVPADTFAIGYHTDILGRDELIAAVRIPKPSATRRLYAHKQAKRHNMDISTLTCCLAFDIIDNTLRHVTTGFGGMAPTPIRPAGLEAFLEGKPFTEDTFLQAAALVPNLFSTISDVRGSTGYRKQVVSNVIITCFWETLKSRQDA
ncbi:MAG: FAD binding domain-containing protein [Bacteroidales bacterium]|jgi:xanthine dehydrogenase small subunit